MSKLWEIESAMYYILTSEIGGIRSADHIAMFLLNSNLFKSKCDIQWKGKNSKL